ncbi:MAG: 50S ribosomal protein L11 methyltransferase [Pyrinomonadaceae bacterium]|nr:50S ribosomal protein L11 methyltransferase [Pyrinomonadaceae bacterium]
MYSIAAYGDMATDRVRMDAYSSALEKAIKPHCVVLDIGCGTGIMSLLACKLGAQRVYAVEPDDAIQVAREAAAANGFSERIVFFQDLAKNLELPERADVIISDLRGVLPLNEHHIPSIVDARQRLLSPDGVLIPLQDTLRLAVVEAPDLYMKYVAPWAKGEHGFDLGAARRIVLNTWRKGRIKPDQLLTEPQCWATLDYLTIESPDVHAELNCTVERAGTAHGLSVWFDTVLAEGVGFSSGPDAPELIYGNGFFPWLQPVDLAVNDVVTIKISADLVDENYIWRWDTRVMSLGSTQVKADFKQSTFFGVPLSLAQLHKRAANYVPKLNDDGQIYPFILSLMDGSNSVEEIAHQAIKHFPARFSALSEALSQVGEVSRKFSQ